MVKKHYETVFIVTPVLSEQQIKDTVDKFRNLLKELGGDIYHEESWGIKKLAYPINHLKTGFYQLFEYNASPELIAKLELEFKRDEKVIRFLTVALDKYAVEYNEKRRKKGTTVKKDSKETKEQEVAS
ncbi:30S ribosomal protein S6 [Rapidithrix thailandica]|uniref:Small ribosomal subunit protein bS6 n=1 Tax=Rapidithrix thailandica TaxID=413964 RepID=A0AAW9SI03_9BACT